MKQHKTQLDKKSKGFNTKQHGSTTTTTKGHESGKVFNKFKKDAYNNNKKYNNNKPKSINNNDQNKREKEDEEEKMEIVDTNKTTETKTTNNTETNELINKIVNKKENDEEEDLDIFDMMEQGKSLQKEVQEEEQNDEDNKASTTLIIPQWYKDIEFEQVKLVELIEQSQIEFKEIKLTTIQTQELYSFAKREYQRALERHSESPTHGEEFEKEFIKKGTLVDKIAALSTLIQQDPIFRLNYIEELMKLVNTVNNHRVSEVGLITCRDVFKNLLLYFRELYTFKKRNDELLVSANDGKLRFERLYQVLQHFEKIGNKNKRKENLEALGKVLSLWYFEELLKNKFTEFIEQVLIENLKEKVNQALDSIRIRVMRLIRDLIKISPEQRGTLIAILISKWNDSKTSINARALYYLHSLVNDRVELNPHYVPTLNRLYLCQEICNFIKNTKIVATKRYYGTALLSIFNYKRETDSAVTTLVLEEGISILKNEISKLFERVTKKKIKQQKQSKEQKSKGAAQFKLENYITFISSLLNALFKALRACSLPPLNAIDETFIDLLFKISKNTPLACAVHACQLIYPIGMLKNDEKILSRFYSVLYDKILDEEHAGSKVQSLLLLVFETVKEDSNIERVAGFCKRLLQSCITCSNPGYFVAVLMIIDRILYRKPAVRLAMVDQKRYLVDIPSQSGKANKDSKEGSSNNSMEDDDEEERFEDVDEDESSTKNKKKEEEKKLSDSVKIVGNQIIVEGLKKKKPQVDSEKKEEDNNEKEDKKVNPSGTNPYTFHSKYDPTNPKPNNSGAILTNLWEFNLFQQHFHPTVKEIAENILKRRSGGNSYKGNPIVELSATSFIERMMMLDAKSHKKHKALQAKGIFSYDKGSAIVENLLKGESMQNFIDLPKSEVKSEERFLHTFLVEKASRKEKEEQLKKQQEEMKKMDQAVKKMDKEIEDMMIEDFDEEEDIIEPELDEDVTQMLLNQLVQEDEDKEDEEGKNKKDKFAFDVTRMEGQVSQDEVAELLEEDEEELLKRASRDNDDEEEQEEEGSSNSKGDNNKTSSLITNNNTSQTLTDKNISNIGNTETTNIVKKKNKKPLEYKGTRFEYIQDCYTYYKTVFEKHVVDKVIYVSKTYPTVVLSYGILFGVLGGLYFRTTYRLNKFYKLVKSKEEDIRKKRVFELVKEANQIKRIGK
ncbi:hypothetical protein ABK040_001445 [Willaertia magna]